MRKQVKLIFFLIENLDILSHVFSVIILVHALFFAKNFCVCVAQPCACRNTWPIQTELSAPDAKIWWNGILLPQMHFVNDCFFTPVLQTAAVSPCSTSFLQAAASLPCSRPFFANGRFAPCLLFLFRIRLCSLLLSRSFPTTCKIWSMTKLAKLHWFHLKQIYFLC